MRNANEQERLYSRILDLLLITLTFGILFYVKYGLKMAILYVALVTITYFILAHSIFSRSIGDLVLGLMIVNKQGNKITPSLAMMRFFAIISTAIYTRYSMGESAQNSKNSSPSGFYQTLYEKYSLTYEKDSGTFLVKLGNKT